MSEALFEQIDRRFDHYLEDLFELLSQPSVSATGEGMETCVTILGDLFEAYGMDHWERIETSRYPVVYGERHVDDEAPTVVFYGHYDVQPPGEESSWSSPPFEPTIRDGAIYARGSGDNKGQFFAHLAAVDALTAGEEDSRINVKLLVEGGEESGSIGLEDHLDSTPVELEDADLVYDADGPLHGSDRPTIVYGNRGILSVELTHETARSDLHSGNFGGPVPNAANELVAALATMFEDDRINIDGFYDEVATTAAQRDLVEGIPFDEAETKRTLGISRFATDRPYYERLLLEPTLTINGIGSGYTGDGMKTIIPHRASAKLDFRLVPDQDPDIVFERVRDHVAAVRPEIDVELMSSFPPMSTPIDTPFAPPIAEALETAWEAEPVEMPLMGGSLPAAYFGHHLGIPVLVVPYANSDQHNHAPDEHLDLECFRNGIRTSALVLRSLANVDTPD